MVGIVDSETSLVAPLAPSQCPVVNDPMTHPSGRCFFRGVCSLLILLLVPGSLLAFVETRAYRVAIVVGHEGREVGQFRQPGSVLVNDAGRLYVADTYNHRIQVFDPDGRFIQTFGIEGTPPGALLRPKGLYLGSHHLLYVADTGNHRIQAFDQGELVMVLGTFGHLPSQFNAPEAVATDESNMLYVADTQNHRVQKFAPDGSLVLSWGGSGSGKGEFLGPSASRSTATGECWSWILRTIVCKSSRPRGNISGKLVRRAGVGEFDTPRGIATDDQGQIYIADTGNGRVQIFDRSGRYLAHVGHLGKLPGEFYYPTALWIDAQKTLYVADTINNRIQVLTYDAALARIEQGWQAFKTSNLNAAEREWTEALRLDPSLAEAFYGLGLASLQQGNLDLAIQQLKSALSLQPHYTDARWALYRAYIDTLTLPLIVGGIIVGVGAGTLLVRRLHRRMLRERARRFLEEGRALETIATYERLLQLDRHDLDVCKTLENLYEQEGLES